MQRDVESLGGAVSSVEDLASFIEALGVDTIERGSEWENLSIAGMLESMAAWLRDSAEGVSLPDLGPAELRFVARVLLAGKHYE